MNLNDAGGPHEAGESKRSQSMEPCERTLALIRERSRPLTLSELAERIVDQREDWLPALDGHEVENHVRIRLHHIDLPKLQERGAIEYDRSLHLVW